MNKLERWLPFKFRRKKGKKGTEKETEKAGAMMAPWFGQNMGEMMQRMFDQTWLRDPFSSFAETETWFGDFAPAKFSPSVDVVDEETALKVTAELPGMAAEDVKVQVDDGVLTIRGEKRHEDEKKEDGVFRSERYYGAFERRLPLPGELDLDKVKAKFENGVLSVTLPKAPGKKSTAKTIPIK